MCFYFVHLGQSVEGRQESDQVRFLMALVQWCSGILLLSILACLVGSTILHLVSVLNDKCAAVC